MPIAIPRIKRRWLILLLLLLLLLFWLFAMDGIQIVNDAIGNNGSSNGDGNGDNGDGDNGDTPDNGDNGDDDNGDDDVPDGTEILIITLSGADIIFPGGNYNKVWTVPSGSSAMSCSIGRMLIVPAPGVGSALWTFSDASGTIFTPIDTGNINTYGSPKIIYNINPGSWQVTIENNFDVTISFSYQILVYGYV